MSQYKVIKFFTDMQDNAHAYNIGDSFPRDGKEVSDERIAELSSEKNKLGVPLITPVGEPVVSAVKEEKEESPKKTSAKAKARRKTK